MLRRVVITGLGAVSPNGIGLKTFWENTCNGISGIDRITSFDPSALACQIAGEVTQFDPSHLFFCIRFKKTAPLHPACCGGDSGSVSPCRDRSCLIFRKRTLKGWGFWSGAEGRDFDFSEKQFEIYFSKQKKKISPYAISNSLVGMLSSEISMYFGLQGRSHVHLQWMHQFHRCPGLCF